MRRLVLVAALLAGCVETATAGDPSKAFNNGDWVLALVDGKTIDYQTTINLGEKDKFSGQAPCNRYFGTLALEGETLTLGPIGATRMMCLQVKGEAEYFSLLQAVDRISATEGEMVLTGAGHELRFIQPIP